MHQVGSIYKEYTRTNGQQNIKKILLLHYVDFIAPYTVMPLYNTNQKMHLLYINILIHKDVSVFQTLAFIFRQTAARAAVLQCVSTLFNL